LLGLLLLAHPVPTAMFVVTLAALAVVAALAAHRVVDPSRLVFLLTGVACAYVAIGAANDYFDRELDAPSRDDKPIVQGLVTPVDAATLASTATLGVVALLAPLGALAVLFALTIEALGMAYNTGLKRTPASGAVVAASFPFLALLAWNVFGRWQAFLPWLFLIGFALGVEMNVANTLPDFEEDAARGVQSLAHALGMRRALAFTRATPVAVLTLMWALNLSGAVPAHPAGMTLASVAALGSTAVAAMVSRSSHRSSLRRAFIVQAWGALTMVTAWLAAVAF
jgi:4-hydroxybenzoate polyprenyltransferase